MGQTRDPWSRCLRHHRSDWGRRQQPTVGTEVIGLRALQNPGTYAEFVTLPADAVTRKPMKLSFEAAAALPLSASGAASDS
ncbi:MAG: hypothetical protein U0787_03510 [Polyangia bacterium]